MWEGDEPFVERGRKMVDREVRSFTPLAALLCQLTLSFEPLQPAFCPLALSPSHPSHPPTITNTHLITVGVWRGPLQARFSPRSRRNQKTGEPGMSDISLVLWANNPLNINNQAFRAACYVPAFFISSFCERERWGEEGWGGRSCLPVDTVLHAPL